MVYSKKYFITSFVLHVLFIGLVALASSYSRVMRNQFIIFGIHSRKPTVVLYKKRQKPQKKRKTISMLPSDIHVKKNAALKNTVKKKIAANKKVAPILDKKAKAGSRKVFKRLSDDALKKKLSCKKIVRNNKKEAAGEKKRKRVDLNKQVSTKKKKIKKVITQDKDSQGKNESKTAQDQENSMRIYQQHIQRAISRSWRPLVGVEKGTLCSVLFTVSDTGNITKARLVKRSGIVLYDLSVMKVAKKFKFHKSLWNKEFTVDFRQ